MTFNCIICNFYLKMLCKYNKRTCYKEKDFVYKLRTVKQNCFLKIHTHMFNALLSSKI